MFGGMSPYPRRLGEGKPRVQIVLEGLCADRGDAYDAFNTESIVYVENMAIARALSAAWGTNERLGNMWLPQHMSSETLERWERILKISPPPTATEAERRDTIETTFSHFGQAAISGRLNTLLSEALGDVFVGIEYINTNVASMTVPDGTYPWGVVSATAPWSSTVCHLLVKTQKPDGWRDVDFYNAVGKVFQTLDPILPVYTTFDWYRPGPTPVNVPGGPSGGGFFLDDESNLDNQVFDE